jgi:phosphate transport system protein
VDELRSDYHRNLAEIDSSLTRTIVLVQEAIAAANAALLSSDDGAASVVAARSDEITALHRSIEALVFTQFGLQAPVAGELRFLIAVVRMVAEIELTAALAGDIARRGTMHIGSELTPRIRGLADQLLEHASAMWLRAEDAYRDRNPEVRDRLEAEDEVIDELYASLTAELASGVIRPPILVEMAQIARFLERLGDHAVEIGRWIESFTSTQLPRTE